MSVSSGITQLEIWFGLGALALTLGAGLFLYPALRSALKDDEPSDRAQ